MHRTQGLRPDHWEAPASRTRRALRALRSTFVRRVFAHSTLFFLLHSVTRVTSSHPIHTHPRRCQPLYSPVPSFYKPHLQPCPPSSAVVPSPCCTLTSWFPIPPAALLLLHVLTRCIYVERGSGGQQQGGEGWATEDCRRPLPPPRRAQRGLPHVVCGTRFLHSFIPRHLEPVIILFETSGAHQQPIPRVSRLSLAPSASSRLAVSPLSSGDM